MNRGIWSNFRELSLDEIWGGAYVVVTARRACLLPAVNALKAGLVH